MLNQLYFNESLSRFVFETESHYITQAGLKLAILLLLSLECWDYRYTPPNPAQ
jgi:hypothetical protein